MIETDDMLSIIPLGYRIAFELAQELSDFVWRYSKGGKIVSKGAELAVIFLDGPFGDALSLLEGYVFLDQFRCGSRYAC